MEVDVVSSFERDIPGNTLPPKLVHIVRCHLADRATVRVLDAGCGDRCRVPLTVPTYTVGVDSSEHQLSRNEDLDERILADLETTPISAEAFDLVVCWNVIEHLQSPIAVLDRLIDGLRSGGLLVLAWPNHASVKAVLARLLPYRTHTMVHKWLFPNAKTGDDRGPFPTVLDKDVAAECILSHAARRGLSVRGMVSYESGSQAKARSKTHLTGWRWRVLKALVSTLSFGRIDAEITELIVVLEKPISSTAGSERERDTSRLIGIRQKRE